VNAYVKISDGLPIEIEKSVRRPVVVTVNDFDEPALGRFAEEMSKAHETGQPVIPVVIDSFGGDAYALLGMIAIIDSARLPVVTICESKAMSCGALLFAVGHQRYAAPAATFMLHDISSEIGGKTEDMKVDVKEMERIQDVVFSRIAKSCGKPKGYFAKLIDQNKHADLYLNATDAKKHGLATEIGTPSLITTVSITHTFAVDGTPKRP
jgi:ATP-dependent protease ClpP protease subunit